MIGRVIVLGPLWGRQAAALMVDGWPEDLIIDPGDLLAFAPGAILRGRVGRLVKGQGGAFVDLPGGARGYLRSRDGLAEGRAVLVQVAGVAEPGKAVPLTTRLLFRGRHAIITPAAEGINVSRRVRDADIRTELAVIGARALAGLPGAGAILRSAAAEAPATEVENELAALTDLAGKVLADGVGDPELLVDAPDPAETAWRDWGTPDAVEEGIDAFVQSGALDAIEALLRPDLPLPGGGHAVIEATRALIAVDVNTGPDTSPAAALKANIALARDLPRQLRLRGLGGQVVVDFAPMPRRDRGTVDQVLRAAFRRDGVQSSLVGWTGMGLYEISRKRDRLPLARWQGMM